jgi:hypothetical protein
VLLPLAAWLLAGRPMGDAWQASDGWLIGSLAAVGGLLVWLSAVAPRYVRPVFIAASIATYPIGWVVGEVMLSVIYFFVFTPVALVFRLIGRDVLERKIDRGAKTYWRLKESRGDVESYFRQS